MKIGLPIATLLLLLFLCGCIHFSRLEVRSRSSGPSVIANATAVEIAVGDVLTRRSFAHVADKRFEQHKHSDPTFVGEWERSEDRGFWYGGEYMSVEMYFTRGMILLVVRSGDGDRRTVVEEISSALENMIHDKFPEFEVHVTSYSYFPFWAA